MKTLKLILITFLLVYFKAEAYPAEELRQDGMIYSSKNLSSKYSGLFGSFSNALPLNINNISLLSAFQSPSEVLYFLDEYYEENSEYFNFMVIDRSNELTFKAALFSIKKITVINKLCSLSSDADCRSKTDVKRLVKRNSSNQLVLSDNLRKTLNSLVYSARLFPVSFDSSKQNLDNTFFFNILSDDNSRSVIAQAEVRVTVNSKFLVKSEALPQNIPSGVTLDKLTSYGSFPFHNIVNIEVGL